MDMWQYDFFNKYNYNTKKNRHKTVSVNNFNITMRQKAGSSRTFYCVISFLK